MVKQNLEGVAAETLPGYKIEIQQMSRRRLRLLGPAEATREYSLGISTEDVTRVKGIHHLQIPRFWASELFF